MLLCFAALALVALLPAWQAGKIDANVLREGSSGDRTCGWNGLVAVLVALCTALLFNEGAVRATLENLRTQGVRMARDKVIGFGLDLDFSNLKAGKHFMQTANALRAAVMEMPGVADAALCSVRLMRGSGMKSTAGRAGTLIPAGEFMNTSTPSAGAGYFETLGQRVVSGRLFTAAEQATGDEGPMRPVVVNETFARHFTNGRPVVGASLGFGAGKLVAARRREIAVRVAVGAMPRDVFALVLGEAVWPVAIALTPGAGAG